MAYAFVYNAAGSLVERQNASACGYGWRMTRVCEGCRALRQNALGSSGALAAPHMPVGFGGQYGYYTDTQTGYQLLTHRYYDPGAGKFINRDPIGYAGGANLYGFCDGNPVNESDPSGFEGGTIVGDPVADPLDPEKVRVTEQLSKSIARFLFRRAGTALLRAVAFNPVTLSGVLFFGSQTRLADDSTGPGSPYWLEQQRKRDAEVKASKGGTYILRDPETGQVMRTGMAANLVNRKSDHKKKYPDLVFEVDKRSSSRDARRGREQIIHDLYKPPLNVNEPISRKNNSKSEIERLINEGRKL